MLDIVIIGVCILLVSSMIGLARWSDKVTKEGKSK